MTTREQVRDALCDVVDPCSAATGSNLDIVEMGLVKDVHIDGGHVEVDMRLTTPVCHMVAYFHQEIEEAVGALPGVSSVNLTTDNGLEWSEAMLTPEAKRKRQAVLDDQRSRYEKEVAGSD